MGLNNDSADIEVGSTFGLIDNLIWSRGRHTFKTGMEYRRVRLNQGQTSNNNLTFGDDYSLSQASLTGISYIAPWCCHGLRRNFLMPYFQGRMEDNSHAHSDSWAALGLLRSCARGDESYDGILMWESVSRCLSGNRIVQRASGIAGSRRPLILLLALANPALYNASYVNFDPRLALAWAPGSAFHGKTSVYPHGLWHLSWRRAE